MTSPDPAGCALAVHMEDARRLRVMQKDKIVIFFKQLRIAARRTEVRLTIRSGKIVRCSLQTVVDFLRNFEEAAVANDCLPMRHQSEVIEYRNGRSQYFGDTSTVGGRVHMNNPRTLEILRGT